jgi:hypothetical protein
LGIGKAFPLGGGRLSAGLAKGSVTGHYSAASIQPKHRSFNMTLTMYSASVPVFSRMLKNLLACLDKAEAWATERKIDTKVLVASRLAPDMIPLSGQIQIATDHAKGASSRLAGKPVPSWEDNEVTYEDLKARIQKTIDYLDTFSEADFIGADTRDVTLKLGGREVLENGQTYLFNRAFANFYFHVTTAYDILRHNGAPLGKRDFIG